MTHPDDGALPLPPACPAHPHRVRLTGEDMNGTLAGLYEQWRKEHGPVVPVELDGAVPAYLVIGHRTLQEVCADETLFTPDSREWSDLREGRVAADWPLLPQVIYQEGSTRFLSGAEHRRLRGILTSGLNQFEASAARRYTEWVAGRLIDRFAASGHADIVADYAAPLPLLVMLRLLGLPHETGEQLLPAIFRLLEGGQDAHDANAEIMDILGRLVAQRRARPERDLASWLIHGPVEPGPSLTDAEVRALAWLTVMAGAGGTTGWIANSMERLVSDDALHSLLLAGRTTVSEIMNDTHWSNPAVHNVLGRFPLEDVRLGGCAIPRGALLILGLAGANADPLVHTDDSKHTLTNEAHFAFGAGPHECPTAAQRLARVIGQTAVERLSARCRSLRLQDDASVQHGGSIIVRQLTSLRVRFTAGTQDTAHPATSDTALGDTSRSSHYLFPPRMLTQLTAQAAR
ncbi:cytochrome P450 [Streptomyces sp. S.PNR 29]|uniref:cytochrome P450 n=1 Tax=Streptomyces sp. S.PNR 29 TaxID=2973805 RepID=UPI0025B23F8E|nr:cytochrome P450 [Streptomyces sp. S.PNR 29]MDN0195136.1 cytochrome P450 [Streptomyces sp. S.PNR 29]